MIWTKRIFDITAAATLLIVLFPLFIFIMLAIKVTSKGSILYWSYRVGKNNKLFRMPKFRSMKTNTPQVATHLLPSPQTYLTPIGGFMRRFSLDELPQLWSIIWGDLSFVGPRPALFNQNDLVAFRTKLNIHQIIPGLTGWAQVNGRDEVPIPLKVQLDYEYLQRRSLILDIQIIAMTLFKVFRSEGVKH
ncbi:MAG: sugar transferase [Terracidiphilus sp.]|jgi:O-antigen biosynthesis protein WbqP